MFIMAEIFRLGDLGITFRVKLVDCALDMDFDVSTVVDQFIIFKKPDGTKLEKQAILVEDPISSGIFFLQFTNITLSILDLIGNWSYAGKVITDSGNVFTSASVLFWVE